MKKLLFVSIVAICILMWYSFSEEYKSSLNIDKYYSWSIRSLLYENKFYTETWNKFDVTSCDIDKLNILEIEDFPTNLQENTIYVLNTWTIFIHDTIQIWNCTSIISKEGTTVNNTHYDWDIFVITWKYVVIDNISIVGNGKWEQYWIKIINTDSITLNKVSLSNLFEWIFSSWSEYIKYSNITIDNIVDYAFFLKNSSYNKITWFNSSYNVWEWLYIEWGWFNELNNIISHHNTGAGIYIAASNNNTIQDVLSYNNLQGIWLFDLSDNCTIQNIKTFNNIEDGIVISSKNSEINYFSSYNNLHDWLFLKNWNNNLCNSWYLYNNTLNWIELNAASENNFSNIYDFNNGKIEGKTGRCWIMLYDKSNENNFTDIHIYNNIIWICSNNSIKNQFKDAKIFNNKTTESIVGNLSWAIIKTWVIVKTGIIQKELTWKLNSWANSIKTWALIIKTGAIKLSFDYMINPHVKDKYLYSWESTYADNIWFKQKFLDIGDNEPKYSIWIMLQNEISGNIITNGENIVANWNIESFEIWEKKYEWNKIKYPINTWDVRNTVATNINWKDIHAMLVLDAEDPTCEVAYSTTWTTTESVIAYLTWCSEEIAWTNTSYPFTKNWEYTFNFTDLVWNSWSARAIVSRIQPKPAWGGGWWGGGWGWGWTNNEKISTDTSSDTWNRNTKFNFNTWVFDSNYSDEMNMAYQYAYHFKITTQKSITEAWMDQALTRIAMAKMLSMYAMNVLWKKPANTIVPNFEDVSEDLNEQYDYWISLAYQLWIMWINMQENKFRPHDLVTRAEFATALSRLLYWTADWNEFYYSTHLNKLFEKWIIANTNPSLQELRWYVMIMLMRSALWISSTEDFVYPEPETETQEIVRYFTEPYKKGQIYSRIWDLQDLLRYLGYYKYWTNYVYSKATINAVYDFQVAMWLIDADDVNNPARWYLWPETRSALNEKWVEFQHYKNWIANE